MKTRNAIYRSKYEAEVALIFSVVVFLVILFSGCMRDLNPALDPISPEWTQRNTQNRESCCCNADMDPGEITDSMLLSNAR